MRYREPYSLYPRKIKNGKKVWYYRTHDEYGSRTTGRSTGETSKTRARQYCSRLLAEGQLVPAKELSFSAYSEHWWVWDSCAYIKGKLARSTSERPSISHRHADDCRAILLNHLLPYFGRYWLSSISPKMLEEFMFSLRDKGLSPKRVNNILSCLRVMLSEAQRLGYIQKNPFDVVRPLAIESQERGILTIEEVRKLFDPANIEPIWKGHLLHRVVNLTAASTGMRQGEILAVRDESIHDGYIHVAHSWGKYGLGPTKSKQKRDVPVPSKVMEAIKPFTGTGGYVFSFTRGKTPATGNRVTKQLYETLERAGVSWEERKRRGICFHSWRAFFNTVMRGRVSDVKLRKVTGHVTVAMTELYTRYNLEDYRDVAQVQEEIFR